MNLIRQRVAKADLGVLVSSKMTPCPRCGFLVAVDARVCSDCGAPLASGAQADLPEEVHQVLAQANLLRLRGEYQEAEKTCLALLRKLPNCAPAHTLLGDIADDCGWLDEAEKWFELAIDLDPESAGDRRKLEDVQARRKAEESASTIDQIGIPARRPIPWLNIILATISVASLTFAAVVGIERKNGPRRGQEVIRTPVAATPDSVVAPQPEGNEPNAVVVPPSTPESTAGTAPPAIDPNGQENQALMKLVAQHSPLGSMVIDIQDDPRVKELTLIYAVKASDDPRRVGAELARTALEQSPESQQVVVRAMRDNHLLFMADVPRSKVAETQNPQWQEANAGNPNAFASTVLTNEWPAPQDDTLRPERGP